MDSKELQDASLLVKCYQLEIDERLPKAKAGDRQSSLNSIAVAGGLMRAGFPLPPKLAEWVSLGLCGVSAGLTTEESFGFAGRKRGERNASTNVRVSNDRFRRAFLVEYLEKTKALSVADACAEVAGVENVSDETVNAAWDSDKYRRPDL